MKDLSVCCASCPNWEVILGLKITSLSDTRFGTCKANFPRTVIYPDGTQSPFPIVAENDWCMPGRIKLQKDFVSNPSEPTERVYSEL